MPGTVPPSTMDFCIWRVPSPDKCLKSAAGNFQNMHQQPPQAPRGPNMRSKSAKRSGVRGVKVNISGQVNLNTTEENPILKLGNARRKYLAIGMGRAGIFQPNLEPGCREFAYILALN